MLGASWWVIGLSLSACASIRSVESTTETPLEPLITREVEPETVEYEVVTSTTSGLELSVAVQQSEKCTRTTTPRVHRQRHITRQADRTTTRATWSLAALGLGAGAYGYIDAEGVALRSSRGATPDEVRQYSLGVLVLGVLATTVGLIDVVRAADSDLDDGVIKQRSEHESYACRSHRTENMNVGLALKNDQVLLSRTDDRGIARFNFHDVPDESFPDGDTEVVVLVRKNRVPVVGFGSRQQIALRENLLADPTSRAALQLSERRRRACDHAVGGARAAVPDQPADAPPAARGLWTTAKSECGDLWTSAYEGERVAVEARLVDQDCRDRLVRAASALDDVSSGPVDEVRDELASIRATCGSPTRETQLRQLEMRLVTLTKQIERARAEEARRIARQEAQAAREARRQQQQIEQRQRSWGSARLLCNDGTLSPSCTCGRDSYRGCCSWHGGVNSCSADSQ